MMRLLPHSFEVGLSFGFTSGIITTLGLMVGLYAGTNSRLAVIGGVFTIAVADSLSDALGIHISEEAENIHSHKQVWESTFSTFISKFIFASVFIVPLLLLGLKTALILNIALGYLLLGVFSWFLARRQKAKPVKVIAEHLLVATGVIALTNWLGLLIKGIFG